MAEHDNDSHDYMGMRHSLALAKKLLEIGARPECRGRLDVKFKDEAGKTAVEWAQEFRGVSGVSEEVFNELIAGIQAVKDNNGDS